MDFWTSAFPELRSAHRGHPEGHSVQASPPAVLATLTFPHCNTFKSFVRFTITISFDMRITFSLYLHTALDQYTTDYHLYFLDNYDSYS